MSSGETVRGRLSLPSASLVALTLNGGLALALLCIWLKMAVLGMFWRADFTALYSGWTIVLDGQSARLYDRDLQSVYYQRALPHPDLHTGLLIYNHPPHSTLLFAPLALLPRWAAFYLWDVIQVGLAMLAWNFLKELTPGWETRTRQILLAAFLAFPPLMLTFQQGQTALVSLVCLLGFACGLKKDRPWATAGWLVLGTIKPQLFAIPAVLLLASRCWRALLIATGLFALWAAITALAFGPKCWWDHLESMHYSAGQFGAAGINPLFMYHLKGLFTAVLGSDRAGLINALSFAALLLAGGLVLWTWRGPWRPEANDFNLRLAFTMMLGLVCNPHCNAYDVLPLVVPTVLFFDYLRRRELPLTLAGTVAILGPFLFLIDLYALISWPGRIRPFLLLMLVLTGWMAWLLFTPAKFFLSSQPDAHVRSEAASSETAPTPPTAAATA